MRFTVPVVGYLSLLIIWSLASATALVLSLLLATPLSIGPLGVTLWFLLLLTGLAAIFTVALFVVKSFLRIHATASSRLRYSWRQGLLLSGWFTSLLALSSLQQINPRDAILLGILLGIIEVYVRLRWP